MLFNDKDILGNFLKANKGKTILVVIANNSQLKGNLKDYDDFHIILETNAYDPELQSVVIPIQNIFAYAAAK